MIGTEGAAVDNQWSGMMRVTFIQLHIDRLRSRARSDWIAHRRALRRARVLLPFLEASLMAYCIDGVDMPTAANLDKRRRD